MSERTNIGTVGLVLSSAPAIEPLTVADVKRHLRLDISEGELAPGALTCALAGAGAGNVDNGAHRYLVTFVTADGETEAGTISAAVTVTDKTTNGKVALSAIQIGGSNVTARKIYRTTAGGTSYLLLTTLADNVTTTYTDNTADSGLGAGAPSTNTTTDPYINTLIAVARRMIEDRTKRRFITQTWKQYQDGFGCRPWLDLYLPPLQSVSSVQYVDVDGVTQTFSSSKYHVSTTHERARIMLNEGETWPDLYQGLDAVIITMVVGYGATRASVPDGLRHAMLLTIGTLWSQREEIITGTIVSQVPKTVDYLISPYLSREF